MLVTRNREGRHGATAGLRGADLDRLISYLLQLDDREIPRATISGLQVADQANAADWSIKTRLAEGDFAFGDRGSILQAIPGALQGMSWIRAANDSRAFTGDPLVTFTLDQAADVYVGIDARVNPPPPWIDGTWTAAGALVVRESLTAFSPQTLPQELPRGPGLARLAGPRGDQQLRGDREVERSAPGAVSERKIESR